MVCEILAKWFRSSPLSSLTGVPSRKVGKTEKSPKIQVLSAGGRLVSELLVMVLGNLLEFT